MWPGRYRPAVAAGPEPDAPERARVVTPARVIALAVTAAALYLLAPSIAHVFSAFPRLRELAPGWIAASVIAEMLSFVSLWWLLALALRTTRWFAVATSQLTSNALSRAVPAGAAAGAALQYRMLTAAGVDTTTAGSGLTAATLLQYASLFALPAIALPIVLVTSNVAGGLVDAAWVGLIAFVVLAVLVAVLLVTDRPIELIGSVVQWLLNHLRRKAPRVEGLPTRLREQRDLIRRALGGQWRQALTASMGKWLFDYLALLASLAAVGAEPDPALVLLAYAASAVLSMIPITPGGLGFVEAGLTATLALAGVGASEAVLATLNYRLVSFWLPLPAGLVAGWLFHRRFRRFEA